MAAVRCAARRLGGSLLQRTQAEEGRLLAPNRLLGSRGISSEVPNEYARKTTKEERARRPTEFQSRMRTFADATKTFTDVTRSLMAKTAKLTFACMVLACGYDNHKTKQKIGK